MRVKLVAAKNRLATGVDRYAREIAAALRAAGVEADEVALERREAHLGPWKVGGFASLWAQRFTTSRGKADILHALDPAVASRRSDVVTIQDILPEQYPELYLTNARARMDDRINRALARRVPFLVCASEATRDELLRRWELAPDRVVTVHHGIDHARFRPVERRAPWMADGRPTLAYIGDDNPRKNLPLVVRALADLKERHRVDARFVRVGPTRFPEVRDECHRLAKEHGVDIVEPGFAQDDDVVALLSHASAFVWPTLAEGFGFPPLEAMACGAPVVALDTPVNREICGPLASYHVNDAPACADAIALALAHPPSTEALVAYARTFTWDAAARGTIALYERALAKRGGRA